LKIQLKVKLEELHFISPFQAIQARE